MGDFNKLIEILKKEVVPALGCTEPVAVALAAANAARISGGQPQQVSVKVSSNIYKNGMAVGIPGVDRVGIDVAAALGAFGGNPGKGLQVLEDIDNISRKRALAFVDDGKVKVEVQDRIGVFVDCMVYTDQGTGRCVIEDGHTNIILVEVNGEVVGKGGKKEKKDGHDGLIKWLQSKKVSEIVDMVRNIPVHEISFLLEGRDMNLAAAQKGLQEKVGMGVGYNMYRLIKEGSLGSHIGEYAAALTAAGADVRMAGVRMPVMSSAGSGNHGLTAILPVAAVAQKIGADDDKLARALALSHLITVYIKSYTGKLSALCGCAVAAAIGASTGIALLMGADNRQVEGAIKNMVANVTGMICDGGKVGCALKLSTAALAAYQSVLLAMEGSVVPCDNGIIHCTVEKTIQNLGKVSYPGMLQTDKIILEVMVENYQTKPRGCVGC